MSSGVLVSRFQSGTVALTICRPVARRAFKVDGVSVRALLMSLVCHVVRPSQEEIRFGNSLKKHAAPARDVVRSSVSWTSEGEALKSMQS